LVYQVPKIAEEARSRFSLFFPVFSGLILTYLTKFDIINDAICNVWAGKPRSTKERNRVSQGKPLAEMKIFGQETLFMR